MNYVWFLTIGGGTAVLGAVLFSGMFSHQPKRGLAAMIALFAVAALGTVFAIYVSRPPSAPVVPPDRGGTEKKLPAGPADQNALPGK